MKNGNYFQCFLKHFEEGVRLFLRFRNAGNSEDDASAATGICVVAEEMGEWAMEARTLANIFEVLDAKSQSAVLPILEVRLIEMISSAKRVLSRFDDRSEATETQCQQLQADADRFIEALRGAHSLAILTLSAGAQSQLNS